MTTEIKIKEKSTVATKQPNMFKVVFVNDDETPMSFVIELLMTIFKHNTESANELTLEIHNSGNAVAGVYNFEIAEQKAMDATKIARLHDHPLIITLEESE